MKNSLLKLFSLSLLLGAAVVLVSCGDDDDEFPVAHDVTLNTTNFPDAIFRAYVASLTGVAEGEVIPAEVLVQIKEIDVYEKVDISSLKGIEYFTELEELYCDVNHLTSLDVSKNVKLKVLYCGDNELTSLDVSKNVKLKKLYCYSNNLTSLDVSKNIQLEVLHFGGNNLTSLDVSKNVQLEELHCGGNHLTSLDVSKNVKLKQLGCEINELTSLIVSPTGALAELICFGNQLQGTKMDALIASLPTVSSGMFKVVSTVDDNNVCTVAQVNAAKAKGWTVQDARGRAYSGS